MQITHSGALHFSWHINPFQICGSIFKGVGPLTFHLYKSTITIKKYQAFSNMIYKIDVQSSNCFYKISMLKKME